MSKIAILGDCHFGVRGDNIAFHDYARKFYENVFFPYLNDNNIDIVIQTGDMFDRRKFINFNTLHLVREYFFNKILDNQITLLTYVGNHDSYFRNTLKVNSLRLLAEPFVARIIEKPQSIILPDGYVVDIIPWVCDENEQEIKDFIAASDSEICFGHFEIKGFEMDRGNVCLVGIDRESLDKYKMVITGHFHHRSSDGHIFYVGSPMEFTWADYGDKRGFHVFDTDTYELEFIENPYKMFHKIIYDDRVETLESIADRTFETYTNTMVKVIVANKDNPILFDHFMDALYKVQPLDVTIVEDFSENLELSEDDAIDQASSTTEILNRYVDSIEIGLDKDKMKNVLHEVYNKALEKESA
jgi:DNA repair exonuclease SbcCD nuclease subunit